VTVCIAAIAKHGDKDVIVAASDTKLSAGGLYSQDMGAMKVRRLHDYWFAMIAGKFNQQRAIVDAIAEEIKDSARPSVRDVIKATTSVYISETRRLAEESVLSKFGLSMIDFIGSREKIGDSLFERTWGEISRIEVECQLLIFGFDGEDARIFSAGSPTSDNPSFTTEYTNPGFAAIGSGSYAADSILYGFRHTDVTPLAKTIYQTCAAKFFAESASDVGELTMLHVVSNDGTMMLTPHSLPDTLRALWLAEGKLKMPQSALQMISEAITQSIPQASAVGTVS
jgi:20S proteasome alpha/beta subunit